MLQQILTRPAEYDVIATLNLNGDYLTDSLAARVGGIGIAPGGNINYNHRPCRVRSHPRHRAKIRRPGQGEPRIGGILSGDMMFRYLGWTEAADLILKGINGPSAKNRYLRLRPSHPGCHRSTHLGVRHGDDRTDDTGRGGVCLNRPLPTPA